MVDLFSTDVEEAKSEHGESIFFTIVEEYTEMNDELCEYQCKTNVRA